MANYTPITTNWKDCKTAAEELGYTGDSVAHVDFDYDWGSSRPQGCFQSDGNGKFHFNKGAGGNSIGNDKILCVRQDQGKKIRFIYLSFVMFIAGIEIIQISN